MASLVRPFFYQKLMVIDLLVFQSSSPSFTVSAIQRHSMTRLGRVFADVTKSLEALPRSSNMEQSYNRTYSTHSNESPASRKMPTPVEILPLKDEVQPQRHKPFGSAANIGVLRS